MSDHVKPEFFDTNIIVIGAGSGGLISALIAAAVKARVTLIEKHKMGGDCLNTGCVPSKALIKTARFLSDVKNSKKYGIKSASADFDFSDVMERVQAVIKKIEPHDSIERFTELGVDCVTGEARLVTPWAVEVNGKTITARNIILASGGRPFVPAIEGLDDVNWYNSDNLWALREQPRRMIVLGGGPIGCEMAQAFNRLGSETTLVEMAPRIMIREDEEISAMVQDKFVSEKMTVLCGTRAVACRRPDGEQILICDQDGTEVQIPFDGLLVAIGRKPNVEGFGLEELGVTLRKNNTVETDEFLRTNFDNIFAVGDVTGPYQFTHTAAHQAWFAAVNSLFGDFKKFKADYSVIPWATFTDPEVARVGLNEADAKQNNIPYEVTRYGIDDLDRAIADSEDHGVVKVLTVPGKDKILGVTIVGAHAGDLIAEYVTAMKYKLGLKKILGTIHIYPTMTEANKMAAGIWQKEHAPQTILNLLERFHRWRRGKSKEA
ncbi:pyridine nucleotide-disulfide oxidoreductase [Chromatiales bacterium (ex Bugula neritina AB1)]|nr:pyridine nucleotide-disulfide oxidoreductase [Chromatiales bacterium (ex Bugula neritina AB1)]